jgi:hypothetical protein
MYHHAKHLAMIEMKLNLRKKRLINGITYFSSNSAKGIQGTLEHIVNPAQKIR